MATKSISQLDAAATLDNGDLFETAIPDAGSASGYASKKMTLAQLADHVANDVVYPDFDTSAQNITGAVNQTLANFADEYDDTATYDVGDIVVYAGNLYKCETAVSTAEAFDPTKWTQGTTADFFAGADATHAFSTTPQIVGKWVDGKDIYEQTYVFTVNDFHGSTVDSAQMKGQFWTDIPTTYDSIWIDYGNSFLMNTNHTTSNPKSHPLNYLAAGAGTFTRTNIQRTNTSNNGKPFVYFENTYTASEWYSIRSDLRWYITIRWTEASV